MSNYMDKLNLDNSTGWAKRFVRYKTGAWLFDMSQKEFERMTKECHTTYKKLLYKPGKIVLVDAKIFEEYLELFPVA